jgi:multiple sugar transport system permease protein
MARDLARAAPVQALASPTRWRRLLVDGAAFALLLAGAAIWLLPFAWAVDTAIKPEKETTIFPVTWIPSHVTFAAFGEVLRTGGLPRWYLNSVIISTVATALTVVLASLAAYAFSQIRFRGRWLLFWLVMAGIMVPGQVLIVPLFMMMNTLNLVDSYAGVILPQIASPIAVFVLKQFFDGIPHELGEAAVMDGCSRFRIYWQIWMPLSRAALAAISIFTFVWTWNNFLWPLIVITSTSMMPLSVGLATVQSSFGLRYAQIMASAVLAALPILVVFVIFQRQIVQGIAGTGIKG